MRFMDMIHETWYALSANKGRSFLTILGIVIGISAVIAMTSLIGGIQNALMGELGFTQARQVTIYAYNPSGAVGFDDLEKIKEQLPEYEILTGYGYASNAISTPTKNVENTQILCVKPDYFEVNGLSLTEGRIFTNSEEAGGARYILIDRLSIKELFGSDDASAVGQTVQIGNNDFEIIGVVDVPSMMSYGVTAFIPYTTAAQRLEQFYPDIQMTGLMYEGTDADALVAKTTEVVSQYFGIDSDQMGVFSFDSVIKEVEATMGMFSLIMGSVASISLFVGGIGIMNMMLTNVTERIREIGLRKSLGARRRDVTKQFLMESIALCVIGGVFGIFLGLAAAWTLGVLISMTGGVGALGIYGENAQITPVLSPQIALGAVAVCVFIGLVFGYYPARRAAKLDPVESLRYQ